ncbi:hypothetical protein H6F67_21115 [Microcoleus sp. FACHB-1515]|uniref:hypothetical protein n=2 Tax=Cyanophyceae TaxID=3028117 RepID=UPI0016863229|nr:hypothetical protein [Microcoleus sp. FACHB-1515]MBD2092354.1 hypothetical protein [Microcoleus sp. FACHB-1515]
MLLLAVIVWLAYFSNSQQFSLYREDFSRVPMAMQWNWSQIWQYWQQIFTVMADTEGRPLHPGLIYLFSHLGFQVGGLSAMYAIAYLLYLLNVLVFYRLMQRSTKNAFFAFTSTLGFALFPVNTNHAWLTSAFGILPAFFLFLIASHLYLSNSKRNRIFSYLLIFISVFCYEKVLPLFWVAPLLKPTWKWQARSRRELLRHTAILIALLLAALIIRKLAGEGRVNRFLDDDGLLQVLLAVAIGPLITIVTFVLKPLQTLTMLEVKWLVPMGLLLVAIAYGLAYLQPKYQAESLPVEADYSQHQFSQICWRLSIAGFASLILAYILTLTGSPDDIYQVNGRDSLVHVAAVFGAAILCGCTCCAIQLAVSRSSRSIATVGLALFFTLLIATGFRVQRDFISIAQYQRTFWTDVSRLCPDMTRRSIILIDFDQDPAGLAQVLSFNRHFPRLLGDIYQFPPGWMNDEDFAKAVQPKTYRLDNGWRKQIAVGDGVLQITDDLAIDQRDLPGRVRSDRVILLKSEQGRLSRQFEPLVLNGQPFPLKQNRSQLKEPPFRPNLLFDLLISP